MDAALRAAGGQGLAAEQIRAVGAACAEHRLVVIEGAAGTGKSTALRAIGRIHHAEGQRILAVSTGGLAARRLGSELRAAGLDCHDLTTAALEARVRRGLLTLDERTTVVWDEAALASTHEQAFLVPHTATTGARLIAVGDGAQGQPVGAGGLWHRLGRLADRTGARAELTQIVRARDPADRRDQHTFRAGHHQAAIRGLADRDRVTVCDTQEQAEDVALHRWNDDRRQGIDSVLFASASNARIDELNAAAQALRQLDGQAGHRIVAPRSSSPAPQTTKRSTAGAGPSLFQRPAR